MSSGFIGSKIAIITKSQYRYVGTIIGIDAQASSILLGNVKCFGTENRGGNFTNTSMVGTVVPIMQFANSDIEDLKIVDEEQTGESQPQVQQQQPSASMPVLSSPPPPPPPVQKPLSIHDDPAVVSAVLSTSTKDLPIGNRLINDLHQLKLSDDQTKTEESRLRTGSGDLGPSWSLLSPSKWETTKPIPQQTQPVNKSKFFDDFSLNSTDSNNRSQQQRWPSTNAPTNQTLRLQDNFHNEQKDDKTNLPVRQPFMSNDRSNSQQQNRYQNGNGHYQQKNFYNNRRPPMNNQQHRRIGGSNRETFQDNGNSYDDEFDFESNNRKFNKITNEDELFNEQPSVLKHDPTVPADFEPIYDKKKSFFDNITPEDTSNVSGPNYTRLRNQDTFGNDRNRRQRQGGNSAAMGGGGGFRRSNHNNYRQQQRNDDFYYRQNNNGYHYRN